MRMLKPVLCALLGFLCQSNVLGQEQKQWAFAMVRSEYKKGTCENMFFTNVFSFTKEVVTNDSKIKKIAEEELKYKFVEQGYHIGSNSIYVKIYPSEQEANIEWQKRLEKERTKALNSDYKDYCDPQIVELAYTGSKYRNEKTYSIFENGWTKLKGGKKVLEVEHLFRYDEILSRLDTARVSVNEKSLSIFENGKIVEYTIDVNNQKALLYYRLYANDTAFFINRHKKALKAIKNQRPYLFDDDDVISYLRLVVDCTEDDNGNAFTILTRNKLTQENFDLRRQELSWVFDLQEPRVVFSNREFSLVKVFVHYKGSLSLAFFKVNNTDGHIEMIDSLLVKTEVSYDSGKRMGAGILISNRGN